MAMFSSSYDELGWSSDRRDGYNQALEEVIAYVQSLKSYYARGVMCSMAESIQGETTCDDILKHLKDMRGAK